MHLQREKIHHAKPAIANTTSNLWPREHYYLAGLRLRLAGRKAWINSNGGKNSNLFFMLRECHPISGPNGDAMHGKLWIVILRHKYICNSAALGKLSMTFIKIQGFINMSPSPHSSILTIKVTSKNIINFLNSVSKWFTPCKQLSKNNYKNKPIPLNYNFCTSPSP